MDCFIKMFQLVRACLEFSPYSHFYTQVLIDIIIKTYNTKVFRSDLLFKSQIGVFIENPKYYPSDIFSELEEKEIGASNKHKEKVEDSAILKEYKKEYKKIYGRHYSHPKKFTEKQFKLWSKKATQLRDSFNDSQIEEFKIELRKLSDLYCKN